MKLDIQRVNQKINKLEELMTNFLEQISRNNLQVATPPTPQVATGKGNIIISYVFHYFDINPYKNGLVHKYQPHQELMTTTV